MNIKQKLSLILIMPILISGCAQMRDKFVRKSKSEEKEQAKTYQSVRKYDVRPSLDLYTKHYIFWRSWHKELLEVLDAKNHKKTEVAVEQDISNLVDMRGMLTDEKAKELQILIDEMNGIEKIIKKQRITGGNRVRIERNLETIGRKIRKGFTYNKMLEFIRSEFVRE